MGTATAGRHHPPVPVRLPAGRGSADQGLTERLVDELRTLPALAGDAPSIAGAAGHALLPGGKLLRPLLLAHRPPRWAATSRRSSLPPRDSSARTRAASSTTTSSTVTTSGAAVRRCTASSASPRPS